MYSQSTPIKAKISLYNENKMRVEFFLFQHLLWAHTPLKVQNSLSLLSIFAQVQPQKVKETRWIKTTQKIFGSAIWAHSVAKLNESIKSSCFNDGDWLYHFANSHVHISLVLNSFLFNLRKETENSILTGCKNLKTWDYSTGSCFSDCRATCHCESTGSEQKIHEIVLKILQNQELSFKTRKVWQNLSSEDKVTGHRSTVLETFLYRVKTDDKFFW